MPRKMLTAADLFPTTNEIHWHAVERANRSMSRAGRSQWNDADRDVYFEVYYDVLEKVAGPDHPAVINYKRETAGIGHNGGPSL